LLLFLLSLLIAAATSPHAAAMAPAWRSGPIATEAVPCDTALAARFLRSIERSAPVVFTKDSLSLRQTPCAVRIIGDSATCARALQAWVRAGGWQSDSLAVVAVGVSGYVVLFRGDTAGEWQMTHWFDAQWTYLRLALGM